VSYRQGTPSTCQVQQEKSNVLYSGQRFKAFLGRPAVKGRAGESTRVTGGRRVRPIHRPWPLIAPALWAGVGRGIPHPPHLSALAGV